MEEQCKARTLPGACTILAQLLHGDDASRSSEIARTECERKDSPDCSEHARQLMLEPDSFSVGLALLTRSCHEQDNIYACQELAEHRIKSPHLSEQAAGRGSGEGV